MRPRVVSDIQMYQTVSGKQPYTEWFTSLDKADRAMIDGRLERVRHGLLGDCKSVGEGVLELRIHSGPGFRIYFAFDGLKLIILLCGGSKSKQDKDIEKAIKYLADYKERA